jgi:hypothetical protein
MCEPCRNKFHALRDVERPCDRPGCVRTWTWPAQAQLEAFATRRQAPRALCAECDAELHQLTDKEVPCNAPGCTRTALLSPKAQLLAASNVPAHGDEAAPADGHPGREPRRGVSMIGPFCAECERVVHKIKDRQVNCGIVGCQRKWLWRADEQFQASAAGRPLDPPPRRMCEECRAEFGKLGDREVRCRTSGCKKTWTWSRSDQLDACVANKPAPKAPARMCNSCFESFSNLKDVERPCRRAGCKGSWVDKRGAQLARLVRGKSGDPYPRYCTECEKELGDLDDREVSCKTENCPGTWTWSKEQQLAAGVKPKKMLELEAAEEAAARAANRQAVQAAQAAAAAAAAAAPNGEEGAAATAPAALAVKGDRKKRNRKRRREVQPPERRCSACAEFLASKKTLEIPCSQCQTPIYWPPESQLQTHLGNWAMPSLCGACKRDATEAARQAAREALRHPGAHPHAPDGHATDGHAPEVQAADGHAPEVQAADGHAPEVQAAAPEAQPDASAAPEPEPPAPAPEAEPAPDNATGSA